MRGEQDWAGWRSGLSRREAIPSKSLVCCVKMYRYSQGWQQALKQFHGQVKIRRAHPGTRVEKRSTGPGQSSLGDTGAIQTRCRLTQANGGSLVSSPHLFLHFSPATSQSDPGVEPQRTWHLFNGTVHAASSSRAPRSSPRSPLPPFRCK